MIKKDFERMPKLSPFESRNEQKKDYYIEKVTFYESDGQTAKTKNSYQLNETVHCAFTVHANRTFYIQDMFVVLEYHHIFRNNFLVAASDVFVPIFSKKIEVKKEVIKDNVYTFHAPFTIPATFLLHKKTSIRPLIVFDDDIDLLYPRAIALYRFEKILQQTTNTLFDTLPEDFYVQLPQDIKELFDFWDGQYRNATFTFGNIGMATLPSDEDQQIDDNYMYKEVILRKKIKTRKYKISSLHLVFNNVTDEYIELDCKVVLTASWMQDPLLMEKRSLFSFTIKRHQPATYYETVLQNLYSKITQHIAENASDF